jgi:hypothetical protein
LKPNGFRAFCSINEGRRESGMIRVANIKIPLDAGADEPLAAALKKLRRTGAW